MIQADFKALKDGDRVRYVQSGRRGYLNIETGELLERQISFFDDNTTVKFGNGKHTLFLRADEVEFA